MNILPKEEIGFESHKGKTQFIKVEKGKGLAIVNGEKKKLNEGDCLIIPPNTKHNILNRGSSSFKIYSIYSHPEHPEKLRQKLKNNI